MYYVNKLIGFLINPMIVAALLGVAAIVLRRFNWRRTAKWCVVAAFGWMWLWMTPTMTWIVGSSLEREFLANGRVPIVETFPEADAIILLGGGIGGDTNLSSYAEMAMSSDRVWQAARLYRAGKATKIVATGFRPQDTTLPLLKDFGLPEDCVSFLIARNTEEEAKRIEKMGFKKILLVTSAWHMKRARLMFNKYASHIEVVCAPADFEQTMMAENMFSFKALLPDVNAFQLNCLALHEWVGIVGYKVLR